MHNNISTYDQHFSRRHAHSTGTGSETSEDITMVTMSELHVSDPQVSRLRDSGIDTGCHGYLRLRTILPQVCVTSDRGAPVITFLRRGHLSEEASSMHFLLHSLYTGSPTRFGLREAIEEKWRRLKEIEAHGDYCSTYTTSFR